MTPSKVHVWLCALFVTVRMFTTQQTPGEIDLTTENMNELKVLSELPLESLLRIKEALQNIGGAGKEELPDTMILPQDSISSKTASALALHYPIRKYDKPYGQIQKKSDYGKVNNFFTMSVTTLAFLAFGGYLLCLIVQAVKFKSPVYGTEPAVTTYGQPTFLVSAGLTKRPQVIKYSRRKKRRAKHIKKIYGLLNTTPVPWILNAANDTLFSLCEGYAKWDIGL